MHDPRLPLISIALCTYNGARFLREQLDSLLGQDYPFLEIVAVDDASSDATPDILAGYADRDRRLSVHRNAHNIGFSANFETAMRLCHGELIAPCDQDDVWLPTKLSRLQALLGDAPMAYCDSELIDASGHSLGRRISDSRCLGDLSDPASIVFGTCIYGHAMLFRRQLLSDALPLPVGMSHDQWLSCVAICQGTIRHCAASLVGYRQHAGAIIGVTGLHRNIPEPPGHKLAAVLEVLVRMRYCARHGREQDRPFFERLSKLLQRWMHFPICIALPLLLAHSRDRLFSTFPHHQRPHFHRASKYIWGLPVRRIIQPRQYAMVNARVAGTVTRTVR